MKRLVLICFLCTVFNVYAQEQRQIKAAKINSEIKIDGLLSEEGWQAVPFESDFRQHFPFDTSLAQTQTSVKMLFDEKFIYVAAICWDPLDGDYVVQSLRRDFSFDVTDNFVVSFDTFQDNENGFSFAVSPYNVQREGLLQRGGTSGPSTSWDNAWFSKVKRYPDRWVVEIAIPKSTIRFKEGVKQWGVNFARNDLKRNENSCWNFVPRNQNVTSIGFFGQLIFEESLSKTGRNTTVIPYVIGGMDQDFENGETSPTLMGNIGGDAKIAVTSSLNLDLTVNPDFAQVEVDRQVTNLSRFSLFFPERRQFFLENSDLFSRFGFSQIRPFFSRNIGLQNGEAIPIIAGARLSGKLNQKWRIGAMNMQTAKKGSANEPGTNYTVAAFQRRVFANSNIGGILVNKLNTENPNDFNTVIGTDFNYASKDNLWRGQVFYHQSFDGTNQKNNLTNASYLLYNGDNLFFIWNHEYVGNGYDPEVGFVPRLYNYNPETGETERFSYWRWEPWIEYKFYPKNDLIIRHGPRVYYSEYQDSSFQTTERLATGSYSVQFKDGSNVSIQGAHNEVKLFYDTDVSFAGNDAIEQGIYGFNWAEIILNTTQRNKIYGGLNLGHGGYYTGDRTFLSGNLNFRIKRWVNFALNYTYNSISLPHLEEDVQLSLISPNVSVTFSNNLFFTTFFQYNDQINNFNINSRLQWRFKPMSDLFIVYTDNYYTTDFNVKNRNLVAKLVYWLPI